MSPYPDQASTLRRLVGERPQGVSVDLNRGSRVIAVAGGKGGVGKTCVSANLAVTFANAGSRVLLIDGDLGLANLDIALGVHPEFRLLDVLEGTVPITEALTKVSDGLFLLPACSGRFELAEIDSAHRHALFTAIDTLEDDFDTIVVDTAAGIGSNALGFAASAQQVLIVATNEPTSVADAYAFIKLLARRWGVKEVGLVANMVASAADGEQVYARLAQMLENFLGVGLRYMGCVPRDSAISRSVCSGLPAVVAEPNSNASRSIRSLADRIARDVAPPEAGGVRLFWNKLVNTRREQ